MGFKDDCTGAVRDIVTTEFNTRVARVVPKTEDITQKDGGVYIDAAYLYADMADSTGMARDFAAEDAAKIIRAYLHAVCRVLRDRGGAIRSFDGDRVMAIFIGDSAADDAVDAALRITWVVGEIVHAQLSFHNDAYFQQWTDNNWRVRHRTGIAIGQALMVRAGVRDNSDLVSIGDAPNIAAKLSDYKGGGTTIITDEVWDKLKYANCFSVDASSDSTEKLSMWSDPASKNIGGLYETIRTSTWRRAYA